MDDARKVLEVVFYSLDVAIKLLKTGRSRDVTAGINKREAIVIKTGGRTYAELLREVKEGMKDKPPLDLEAVKKTKAGDILMITRGGKEEAKRIKAMVNQVTNAVTVLKEEEDTMLIHIYDLDGAVVKEELEAAVGREEQSLGNGAVRIMSMRPTASGNQNATIALPRDAAVRILKKGRVKVGWTMCKVRERVDIKKCYNCQGMGHMARECKGPNRRDTCFRCGEKDHKAKECNREEFCAVCEVTGHRVGTGRCPEFRKALKRAKAREKKFY